LVSFAFLSLNLRTTVEVGSGGEGVVNDFDYNLMKDVHPSGTQGWTTVETVVIRLDTGSAPSGRFPVSLNQTLPNSDWIWSVVGYDAAVCVQKYEPWIIETYNTSIGSPPYAFGIVKNENSGTSLSRIRGPSIVGSTRYLNITGKDPAFNRARSIALYRMWNLVNYLGSDFIPSPTVSPIVLLRTAFF